MKKIFLLSAFLFFIVIGTAQVKKGRDPLKWPFAKTSIWNMPIHKNAVYKKADLWITELTAFKAEEDIIIQTPNEPMMPVYKNWAQWTTGLDRCKAFDYITNKGDTMPYTIINPQTKKLDTIADGTILFYAPIPRNWIFKNPKNNGKVEFGPDTWNVEYADNCAAILLPNGKFEQTAPFVKCDTDIATSAAYFTYTKSFDEKGRIPYPADSCVLKGECAVGKGHGAGSLSSIGGTVRYGEFAAGVIPHALKLMMWGFYNYFSDTAKKNYGHRWPAGTADGGYYRYLNDDGSVNYWSYYGGTNPALQLGSLLAIHRNINLVKVPPGMTLSTDDRADTCINCTGNVLQLESRPGMIIAKALQDYGGYVVDNTTSDAYHLSVERNANGLRVADEFTSLFNDTLMIGDTENHTNLRDTPWGRDIRRILHNLYIIDNNTGYDNIGGGPTTDTINRRAPMAPDFYPYIAPGQNFQRTAFTKDGKLLGLIQQNGVNRLYRYNIDQTLDPAFGNGGKIDLDSIVVASNPVFTNTNTPYDLAVDNSGRIIVAEKFTYYVSGTPVTDYFLRRYNNNGTIDNSFAKNGKSDALAQDNPFSPGWFGPLAVQSDNKIVLTSAIYARSGYPHFFTVQRLNVDGSIDFTVRSEGTLRSNGDNFLPTSLAVQKNGSIVVQLFKQSYSYELSRNVDSMVLVRLQSNGTFDPGFGSGGVKSYDLNINPDKQQTIALQSNGRILVVTKDNKIVRILNDGTIDPSFGKNGTVTQNLVNPINKILVPLNPPTGNNNTKTLVHSEKFLIGGNSNGNFAIASFYSNGTVDPYFGNAGVITTDFESTEAVENMGLFDSRLYAYGAGLLTSYDYTLYFVKTAFDPKGKLVGLASEDGLHKLYRFNTDGTPDVSFGNGGAVVVDTSVIQPFPDIATIRYVNTVQNLAVDNLGRVLVQERLQYNTFAAPFTVYIMRRYNNNGSTDMLFGTKGKIDLAQGTLGGAEQIGPMAVLNEKFVVTRSFGNSPAVEVKRFNSAGKQEFSTTLFTQEAGVRNPVALAIQPNEKTVLEIRQPAPRSLLLVRLNSNGALDPSFGIGGKADYQMSTGPMALQNDGKILVARADTSIIRFDTAGLVDISQFQPFSQRIKVIKIIPNPNGKIYLGGRLNGDFALSRYNGDVIDESFGNGGSITTDFGGLEGIENMALAGNIVYAYGNGILTSYQAGACTPPTFLNNNQIILDASCKGNDGQIYLIPTSGTAPFQYSINGGTTYVQGPSAGYTFSGLPAGTYQLRLKDANGCESAIVTKIVRPNAFGSCATIAVGNARQATTLDGQAANIRVYPNPNKGRFQLQLDGFNSRVRVEIFNTDGRMVLQKEVNAINHNRVDVDLGTKTKGMYFIKVVSAKGTGVTRVIIQ